MVKNEIFKAGLGADIGSISQQAKGTELLNTVYYKDREIKHE